MSLEELGGGKPFDGMINSTAKDFVVAPSIVETSVPNNPKSNIVCSPTANLKSSNPGVILKTTPDLSNDGVQCPLFIAKVPCIPGNPNLLRGKTTQERPEGGKFTKLPRELLSKDAMVPIQVKVDRRVVGASLDGMDEG